MLVTKEIGNLPLRIREKNKVEEVYKKTQKFFVTRESGSMASPPPRFEVPIGEKLMPPQLL